MNIENDEAGAFSLTVNRNELSLLSNALNEVCNGIDVQEFSTRLGSSREEAVKLLEIVRSAL